MVCLFIVGGSCVAGERCVGIVGRLSLIDDFDLAASYALDVLIICRVKCVSRAAMAIGGGDVYTGIRCTVLVHLWLRHLALRTPVVSHA